MHPTFVEFVFAHAFTNVYVRGKGKKIQPGKSFDSTAFLSWRHLLPSSNLSVYQAKMLSERLLRRLDNPTTTAAAATIATKYTLFLHCSFPILTASLSTAQLNTQTHKTTPPASFLRRHSQPLTPAEYCYPEAVWQADTEA